MNIITQKMTFGGKSLGNFNGKSVFVPFSLPGEELRVETVKSARDYDEARIVEIIKPSPHRVQPQCPLYQKCGGCNFMHIDSSYQVELKKQVMQDVFSRAGIELPPVKVIAKKTFSYRARIELHGGGFEERGTNNAIPIEQCPVATPQINEFLKATPIKKRPRGRCLVFGSQNASPKTAAVELQTSKTQLSTPHKIEIALCGKKILFDAKGFFQSNIEVLEEAIPQIMNEIRRQGEAYREQTTLSLAHSHLPLSKSTALDIYSGCGTFSVFLADIFQHVTMVEHNKGAVVFAEQNMTGKKHSTYAVSGTNFVKNHAAKFVSEHGNFDLVFADPPRSGLEKEVSMWLCKSGVGQIAYLSCDAATQARDVAKLAQSGYTVKEAWLLDFYPQTSHIETFLYCIKK